MLNTHSHRRGGSAYPPAREKVELSSGQIAHGGRPLVSIFCSDGLIAGAYADPTPQTNPLIYSILQRRSRSYALDRQKHSSWPPI